MRKKDYDTVFFWHGLTERQVQAWEKRSMKTGETGMDFIREMSRRKFEREQKAEAEAAKKTASRKKAASASSGKITQKFRTRSWRFDTPSSGQCRVPQTDSIHRSPQDTCRSVAPSAT